MTPPPATGRTGNKPIPFPSLFCLSCGPHRQTARRLRWRRNRQRSRSAWQWRRDLRRRLLIRRGRLPVPGARRLGAGQARSGPDRTQPVRPQPHCLHQGDCRRIGRLDHRRARRGGRRRRAEAAAGAGTASRHAGIPVHRPVVLRRLGRDARPRAAGRARPAGHQRPRAGCPGQLAARRLGPRRDRRTRAAPDQGGAGPEPGNVQSAQGGSRVPYLADHCIST